jgi:hypothetical protein
MKQTAKLVGVAVAAVSIVVSTALAAYTPRPGTGRPSSGETGSSFRNGRHGGGFSGGNHGGHYGGHYHHRNWSWGGWYPWGLSFSYVYSPPPYYYYSYPPPPVYYSPPVVYSSPTAVVEASPSPTPVVENPQQPAVDRPLPPSAAVQDSPAPSPSSKIQSLPPVQRDGQGQPLGLADIKALVKAGLSDEIVISQVRNSHTVYHLSAAEIIDLKETGVSNKVIDYLINTASQSRR